MRSIPWTSNCSGSLMWLLIPPVHPLATFTAQCRGSGSGSGGGVRFAKSLPGTGPCLVTARPQYECRGGSLSCNGLIPACTLITHQILTRYIQGSHIRTSSWSSVSVTDEALYNKKLVWVFKTCISAENKIYLVLVVRARTCQWKRQGFCGPQGLLVVRRQPWVWLMRLIHGGGGKPDATPSLPLSSHLWTLQRFNLDPLLTLENE